MKRFLSTLLAVVLLFSCLSLTATAEEAPHLTVGFPPEPSIPSFENNIFTWYMEEKTGIKFDFVVYSSEYETQLALQIASKEELPDVLLNMHLSDEVRNQYGRDGYFLDLMPLMEEYCETFWSNFSYLSDADKFNLIAYGTDSISGGFYGYPGFEEVTAMITQLPSAINKAWLDAIGEDIPRTIDDLYVVLQKFATEDPNGNGLADEIPVFGSTSGFMMDVITFIMNAFVHVNDTYFWNCTDGELWAPQVTDEYREGLIYLNKLYEEGLISPLVFTMNSTEASTAMKTAISPLEGVTTAGLVTYVNSLNVNTGAETYKEYVAFPPLEDATGMGGYTPQNGNSYIYDCYVTKDCDDVELAMKLLDALSGWDVYNLYAFGVEGAQWVREPGTTNYGTLGMVKKMTATLETMDPTLNPNWGGENEILRNIAASGRVDLSSTGLGWGGGAKYLMKQTITCPDGFVNAIVVDDGSWNAVLSKMNGDNFRLTLAARQLEEPVYKLMYNAEETERIKDFEYENFVKEQRALFVTGALDPNDDDAWQKYVDEMEARGLSEARDMAQVAYDRIAGK